MQQQQPPILVQYILRCGRGSHARVYSGIYLRIGSSGLPEDGIGPVRWSLAYHGIPRADVRSGKASFDGQGQVTNPSEGPSERDTSSASDPHTGLLSSCAAALCSRHAAHPCSVAARSSCVSNSRYFDGWRYQSTECSGSGT
ncbi:TPA: hypothetical protein ACH3X2_004624 [Trebouxia sp. C0005]